MLCILLQGMQRITIDVGIVGFYISILGVVGAIVAGVWRISRLFNGKADRFNTNNALEKKVGKVDFDKYVREHSKLHDVLNESFLREVEKANVATQQFVQDMVARMEESSQFQKDFNKDISKRQDELFKQQGEVLVKVGKIEANLEILINDFNNRQLIRKEKR